jgi:uncharacterized protein (TIGR02246 family)
MTDVTEERAIERVLALYRMLLDDRRLDAWGELFAEDSSWIVPGAAFHGRAAIVEAVGGMQPPHPGWAKHLAFPAVVDVTSPTTALAWSDFTAFVRAADGTWSVAAAGRYYDELVNEGGRWRFKARRTDLDRATQPLPDLVPVPAR